MQHEHCFSLPELEKFRGYKKKIYALIGADLSHSKSAAPHNAVMKARALDAEYIKINVSPSILAHFFALARELPFGGLSVTMPLKELVGSFLDEVSPEAFAIGAINTVHFRHGKAIGYNTDGIGAVSAVEEKVKLSGKRLLIIGAGGSARAIAFEAKKRGASIVVLNRSEERASNIAKSFHLEGWGSLQSIAKECKEGYDVLINCTPVALPIDPEYILKSAIIMDIKTVPLPHSLLTCAAEKGSTVVFGYEMWVKQAVAQVRLWFGDRIEMQGVEELLEREILKRIFP